MYYVHVIMKNKYLDRRPMAHLPRVGDELRYDFSKGIEFYSVDQIVWCMDEKCDWPEGAIRVNIGVKKIKLKEIK